MSYRQPRAPEYREGEGVNMRSLILFLKEFAAQAWAANNRRRREVQALEARVRALEERTDA